MRRWAALALVAAFSLSALAARADSGASRAQDEAKIHAQVENALNLETYARDQLKAGNETAATHALGESMSEMDAAEDIIEDLHPPSWMAHDNSWLLDEFSSRVDDYDQDALKDMARDEQDDAVETVGNAIVEKQKLLTTLGRMSRGPCTEATNLMSPFSVNGVTQPGLPQVQFLFSCKEMIKRVELDTPGQTLSSCDGDGHTCAVKNGDDVVYDAGDLKMFGFTISGPTLANGQKAEVEVNGDIVPIAGDSSSSLQDDVM